MNPNRVRRQGGSLMPRVNVCYTTMVTAGRSPIVRIVAPNTENEDRETLVYPPSMTAKECNSHSCCWAVRRNKRSSTENGLKLGRHHGSSVHHRIISCRHTVWIIPESVSVRGLVLVLGNTLPVQVQTMRLCSHPLWRPFVIPVRIAGLSSRGVFRS